MKRSLKIIIFNDKVNYWQTTKTNIDKESYHQYRIRSKAIAIDLAGDAAGVGERQGFDFDDNSYDADNDDDDNDDDNDDDDDDNYDDDDNLLEWEQLHY